jgi:hypothetical protein
MKAASIAEIKKQLVKLDQGQLLEIILQLARFKTDNKELLTYALFLSANETAFVGNLCEEIREQFQVSPNMHKKTLRKTIRVMDKWLRFSASKETELTVRVCFCRSLISSETPFRDRRVMFNMYAAQIKKIKKLVESHHQDLQHDYWKDFKDLELN